MSTTVTVYGTIDKDGNKVSGSGFESSKQKSGQFLIDFDQKFNAIPAIVGSQTGYDEQNENPLDNVVFPFLNTGSATANTGDASGGLSSRQFSFIAMGEVD